MAAGARDSATVTIERLLASGFWNDRRETQAAGA
jgi:hypothetical protein